MVESEMALYFVNFIQICISYFNCIYSKIVKYDFLGKVKRYAFINTEIDIFLQYGISKQRFCDICKIVLSWSNQQILLCS